MADVVLPFIGGITLLPIGVILAVDAAVLELV